MSVNTFGVEENIELIVEDYEPSVEVLAETARIMESVDVEGERAFAVDWGNEVYELVFEMTDVDFLTSIDRESFENVRALYVANVSEVTRFPIEVVLSVISALRFSAGD